MEDNENVVLVDENGEEHEFALIDVLEIDGEEYAILEPLEVDEDADEDEDEESADAIILKIGQDENGEEILYDIEDDEEWEMVAQKWQEIIEQEDEEVDEEGEEK